MVGPAHRSLPVAPNAIHRATRLVQGTPVPRIGVQVHLLGIARIADGVVTVVAVELIDLATLDTAGRERLARAYHALLNGLDRPIQIVARHVRHGLEAHRERHAAWVRTHAPVSRRLAQLGRGRLRSCATWRGGTCWSVSSFLAVAADPVGKRVAAGLAERLRGCPAAGGTPSHRGVALPRVAASAPPESPFRYAAVRAGTGQATGQERIRVSLPSCVRGDARCLPSL